MSAMTAMDKLIANAEIWDVHTINNSVGNFYCVTLEIKNRKYRFRVDANGTSYEIERVNE